MKIVGKKLLVEPIKKEVLDSGLIINDQSQLKEPRQGIIKQVGEGVHPELSIGKKVTFNHFAGHDIEIDGVRLLLIHENDLYTVILK